MPPQGNPPLIGASPPQIDFGNVTINTSVTQVVQFYNSSTFQPLHLTGITNSNPAFVLSGLPAFPLVLVPSGGININVTFNAPATVGLQTDTVIATSSDAPNSPFGVPLTGTAVGTGTAQISIAPSRWVFPLTKVGLNSPTETFTITNTGSINLTITAITFLAPFNGTVPTLPALITPGATLQFTVYFTPAGRGYVVVPNAITITSTAATSPTLVQLEGQGTGINPAYYVVGGTENGYTAFGSILRQFQATNFNCEAQAFLKKLIQPAQGMETTLQRVLFQFEDFGLCQLFLTAVTTRYATTTANITPQSNSQTINIGSTFAAGVLMNAMADLILQGNTLLLQMVAQGPLVLVSYDPEIVQAGEVKKT